MSQQNPGTQTTQTGVQTGGQWTGSQPLGSQGTSGRGTSGQVSQGMGQQSRDRLSPRQRTALASVAEAIEVCGWCADQCVQEADPNMIECIRLCEDVVELGETVLALAPRTSRQTDSVIQAFQQAVQACGRECGRHQKDHCQQCAQVLGTTANEARQLGRSGGQMATH